MQKNQGLRHTPLYHHGPWSVLGPRWTGPISSGADKSRKPASSSARSVADWMARPICRFAQDHLACGISRAGLAAETPPGTDGYYVMEAPRASRMAVLDGSMDEENAGLALAAATGTRCLEGVANRSAI